MKTNVKSVALSLAFFTAVVILSFVLTACPPVIEDEVSNVLEFEGPLNLGKWTDIMDEIEAGKRIVTLDLSAMTAPNSGGDILKRAHEDGKDYVPCDCVNVHTCGRNIYDDYILFSPGMSGKTGKEYIKAIILPDVTTMINNASHNIEFESIDDDDDGETSNYAFRHFTRLESVTGRNIRLIGTFAFYNATTLTEAVFPKVVHVMQYAFYNCSSVKSFDFERLADIMPSAFENCTSLEKAAFHSARAVSQRAFKGCTSLTEVNFSNVLRVELEAFRNCTSLRVARFLANPLPNVTNHPLKNWRDNVPPPVKPYADRTLAFENMAFRGCVSFETLDARNAWNVYFGAGALADIGTSLTLYLYDDAGYENSYIDGGVRHDFITFGHPQVELLLGGDHPSEDIGELTLTELRIIAPVVEPIASLPPGTPPGLPHPTGSQILYKDNPANPAPPPSRVDDGYASIRNRINSVYNPGERYKDYNEPKEYVIRVFVNGRPDLSRLDPEE
ncbi:MAG: leucine-rich repeat domain-containing protein [Treponema sp.]|nr:leucine-rich repeat domain-containing protein [Treponema sp.]